MPQAKRAVHGMYVLVAVGTMLGCGAEVDKQHSPTQDVMTSAKAGRILDKKAVTAVLPSPDDVPPGWTQIVPPEFQGRKPEDGVMAFGRRGYAAPDDVHGGVGFTLTSFQSRARAIDAFTKEKSQLSSGHLGSVQIRHVDAAFTASSCVSESNCNTSIHVRVDSVYAFVNVNTGGPEAANPEILNAVTRMFVQRIRQAQAGQQASAKSS